VNQAVLILRDIGCLQFAPVSDCMTGQLVAWLSALLGHIGPNMNAIADRLLPYLFGAIVAIYSAYLVLAVGAYGLVQGLLALDTTVSATPAPAGPTDSLTITCRSATNPKAPSAKPSKGSSAVRPGNIAAAGIRLLRPIAKRKPSALIGSNLSKVDMRDWRCLRTADALRGSESYDNRSHL
jgi:hypothetical protein